MGGSGNYDSGFGSVNALTTAGDILLKGGTISADGAEGSYIALGAVGGKIDGNGLSGTILSSPSGPIYLGALKGIGTVGNPVRFTDDGQDIEVCNGGDFLAMCSTPQAGRSGDIVLAQTTGLLYIDGISNVLNLADNGGFDITAETGGILVTNNITLAANGSGNIGLHALGGSIQIDNGSGLTTANGTITLQSDALDLFGDPGSINAGATGTVALRAALPTTSINLGGIGSAGILGIDNSTLSSISAGAVRIGDLANTDGIAVSGIDLTGIANTLSLVTGSGDITQSGALTATNLAIKSNGNVTLDHASNSVLNVAADLTGGVGALGFTATGYNVAGPAIDGVSGVKTNGGNITLASPNPGEGIFVASSGGGYTIDTGLVGGVLTISTGDWLVVNDGADMRAGQIALSSANSLGIAVGQINLVATGVGATAVNFSAPSGPITSSADITSAGGVRMNSDGDIRLDNGHSGSTIIAAGAVDIQSVNGLLQTGIADTDYVNITGGSVTLQARRTIDLGRGASGSSGTVHATAGDIIITSLTDSFGGCTTVTSCYRGNVIADAGNITILSNAYTSARGDIAASGAVLIRDTSTVDPFRQIRVKNVTAGTSITIDSASIIHHDPALGGLLSAPTINLTSATGMSLRVASNGVNLSAVNTGPTGDVQLTSTAPTFTVGGGGATISNAAPGGGYYITAQNDLVLNGGTADDRQALFGAQGMLTVNGYSNASGMGVLMAGNNIAFNGATNVSGALGVIGNNVDINTTVQGSSVNVVAGALNVNGGDFQSTAGNFTGTVTGDVNVAGGGRIYGNPDVNLTVGGTIFINGANSKIEAFSPTSIRVLFPLLASGGFQINGAAGTVWDVITNTGFFAGGLPAVLGGSLQITYGVVGLGHPFHMDIEQVDEIPRAANNKFEEFISELVD